MVAGKGAAFLEEGETGNVDSFPCIEGPVGPGEVVCTEAC